MNDMVGLRSEAVQAKIKYEAAIAKYFNEIIFKVEVQH